jgi:hypothetical protein
MKDEMYSRARRTPGSAAAIAEEASSAMGVPAPTEPLRYVFPFHYI